MRMFMTGFEKETHLRFASLDLVRGEWRSYSKDLYPVGKLPVSSGELDVQAINIEENSENKNTIIEGIFNTNIVGNQATNVIAGTPLVNSKLLLI